MEFIRFIFSSIWVWLSFSVTLLLVLGGMTSIIKALRGSKKIRVSYDENGRRVAVIENATKADVQWVVEHVKNAKGDTNDTAIFDAVDNMHTPHNDSFCISLWDDFIVMDVCKIKSANNSPTDMEKAGRKSKAKK